MEKLGMSLNGFGNDDVSILFRSIEEGASLKHLRIYHINGFMISCATIERLLLMCWMTTSVKELDFRRCCFDGNSLSYLLKALSKRTIIDNLNLSFVATTTKSNWQAILPSVRVSKLVLADENLASGPVIQQFAGHEYIQHLNFIQCSDSFLRSGVCEFLQENTSPLELILDPRAVFKGPSIRGIESQSPGLKSITCHSLANIDLVDFARRVADMHCLRKLTLGQFPEAILSEEFFLILAQSMKQNTSLCTLSLPECLATNAAIRSHLVNIRCFLAINRVGRMRLIEHHDPVPDSLWARVLVRSSCDPDGIFYALRERPDLCGYRQPTVMAATHDDENPTKRPRFL
jgi:hypothetical protein